MTALETLPMAPVNVDNIVAKNAIRYSICTLVTKYQDYREMHASFVKQGFATPDCEFIYIDNANGNAHDAFAGINLFLDQARGHYIILCHQDVLLLHADRRRLDGVLAELDRIDPLWAACGNSGGIRPGRLAIRITDPHGEDQRTEALPARVQSLDENFIVVRRDANLAVSHKLAGFHFYGTDLCIVADILGRSAYVVDFHLFHKSGGKKDPSFEQLRRAMIDNYRRAFRPRLVTTPNAILALSPSRFVCWLANTPFIVKSLGRIGRLATALLASSPPR